jgi:hypothetical protein
MAVGKGRLKVFKWNDLNGNGIWETGEAPLGGFEFRLTGPANLTVETDEWGEAFIYNLPYGLYTVTENVPAGWSVTSKNPQTVRLKSPILNEVRFGNRQTGATTTTLIDICRKNLSGSPSENEVSLCGASGGRILCGNGWCACYCGQATTSTVQTTSTTLLCPGCKKPKTCDSCSDGTACGSRNSKGDLCRCKDRDKDALTDYCTIFKSR